MNLKSIAKRLFFRWAPAAAIKFLLKRYYLRRLKAYSGSGEWERIERDMEIVKHFVASGDSVVDVGANFGFYTAFLSILAGERGVVYSFEPIPLTFEILSHNVQALPLANVKAFNYAISEKDGSGVMVIPSWSASGGENFYQASIRTAKTEDDRFKQVQVGLKKLDSLFSGHEKRIGFIKIDVEGHELQVVEGARSVISRYKPALYIEISDNPDDRQSSAFTIFSHLEKDGYEPYWYDGQKVKRRVSGDRSVNYFFLTQDHCIQLERSGAKIALP
jgi:FkbM family methyltransferase